MLKTRSAVFCGLFLSISLGVPCWAGESPFRFEDVTETMGIAGHLAAWELGHGAAWGDVSGNGLPDLYVGAYADRVVYADPDAAIPNMLFLNEEDRFVLSPDEGIRFDARGQPREQRARTAMALFADLNDNGKLDLLVGNHAQRRSPESRLFENRWPDDFRDVTPAGEDGGWPRHLDMRNAAAVDLNQNGLLDLILLDGRYENGVRRTLALRNLGGFAFEDVSEEYGFPSDDTPGLGLAIGDVNNNGRPDFFVAHSNRMLISQPDGAYREYRPGYFREPEFTGWPCGAVFADLTGNDLLDLVFTVHGEPPQIFVYVNRGIDSDGFPQFEDVTEAAGLDLAYPERGAPLPWAPEEEARIELRAAHLALVDVDNNGRRDILLAMIHLDDEGRVQPVVFRNDGVEDGAPRFSGPPVESWLGYYAAAPVADFDRDGRVDIFMARWHDTLKNHLFRNVTDGGNYLTVSVAGNASDLNRMGVGAVVRIYEAGYAGEGERLLGRFDIVVGSGYASGEEARAHFGLGEAERCDVMITWQGYETTLSNVAANQHIEAIVGAEDAKTQRQLAESE